MWTPIKILSQALLCIILFPFISRSQAVPINCRDFKNGFFYCYPKNSKAVFTIERTGDLQKQIDITNHDTSTFKLYWVSDCVYSLQFLSGTKWDGAQKALAAKHKLLVQISGVSQDYYVYKMYQDKVSDFETESDTLWMKEKTFDDRVYNEHDQSEANFAGGESAWTSYITKIIKKHIQALVRDNKTGTCYVNFIVDTDGSVSDVEALTMEDTKLAKFCIDAIRNGPKWSPAMQSGKAVKAYRVQPVTFNIQESGQ